MFNSIRPMMSHFSHSAFGQHKITPLNIKGIVGDVHQATKRILPGSQGLLTQFDEEDKVAFLNLRPTTGQIELRALGGKNNDGDVFIISRSGHITHSSHRTSEQPVTEATHESVLSKLRTLVNNLVNAELHSLTNRCLKLQTDVSCN